MRDMDPFITGHGIVLGLVAVFAAVGLLRALVSGQAGFRGAGIDRRHHPVTYGLLILVCVIIVAGAGLWAYEDGAQLFGWPTLDIAGLAGEPPQD